MEAALLVLLVASPAHGWLADLARIGKHARDIPLLSTSLDTEEEVWLHELNHRRSDPLVPSLLSVDQHGQLFTERELECKETPLTSYIGSWSGVEGCHGLAYLIHPLTIANSSCGLQNDRLILGNYYGLACSHDRESWCQREYKKDVVWPMDMQRICSVRRTGVDKSRCYQSGKLEVEFDVICSLADGTSVASLVTYHLLLEDRPIRKTHNRVRRALSAKPPFFKQSQYNVNVKEEGSKNHLVTTIQASNPEGGPLTYSMVALVDSRSQAMFAIDPSSATITTNNKLDREFMDVHYLRIVATSQDTPQRTATTTLQINVEDINDHVPIFEEASYSTEVKESMSVGSTVTTVRATDKDSGKNGEVLYTIKSQTSKPDVFRIDPKSGVISTRLKLDREAESTHTIVVEATDQGPPAERLSASTTVTITVLDENDNYPQFSQKTYYLQVEEDIDFSRRPVVGRVAAYDEDEGLNSIIQYSLIGGNTANQFSVDEDSGDITVTKQLDHETTKTYRLVIRAQDRGGPPRSNTTTVIINIDDINDHAPQFYSQYFQEAVAEDVPVGNSIVRIQAYDGDEGENSRISYALVDVTEPFPFAIDQETGWLTTTKTLDREGQSSFQFGVEASDHGVPRRTERATVIIQVQDRNDNDPTFQKKIYEASAFETDPPGTAVINVLALDKDEDSRVHYDITGGNTRNRFSITTQNAQGVISIAQPLDYQQEKRFLLTISATDSGGRFDTATVYINITDANTHPPRFENSPYSVNVFEDAPNETTVLVVVATDKDVGENARITYGISDEESSDFKIDPNTGAIMINRPLDRETGEVYVLTVTAHDNGIPRMSDTTDVEIVIVDVNDNKPLFTQTNYHGSVREDSIPGTSILEILATDRDQDLNGRIVYTFDNGGNDGDGAFVVDAASGIVRTSRPLDRETVPYYQLTAVAIDRGTPQLSTTVPIMVDITDINDNPPIFSSDQLEFFIKENSPIGSVVGVVEAADPDEGENAKVTYSIIGGRDANLFHLDVSTGADASARLISNTEFDHETDKTVFELLLRAESPPLRTDIHVVVKVQDQNDNSPQLSDFRIVFNNYENNFPTEPIGRIPAYDADAMDVLNYNITYGNNANVLNIHPRTGEISLSPTLNTNVPTHAQMGVSVYDGKNEVRSVLSLDVLLVTKEMMHHSVTLRLNNMTEDAFLSPLFSFFVDSLSAVVPAPRENIHVFSIKSDSEVQADILNVTFSITQPGSLDEQYLDPSYIQHKIYLNLETLIRLSTIQILPFDDNICIREPCLNFEHCQTRLMFGSARKFEKGESILFRSIHPVKTHSCECPIGFTGEKNHYTCDIEVDMCYSNPCQNQGTCVSKEGGYTCVCHENYTGDNCELSLLTDTCQPDVCAAPSSCAPLIQGGFICENCTQSPFYNDFCKLEARSFSNGAFLSLPSLTQRFKFNIQLEFATIEHSGLLLYNGRFNGKHDFISLSIEGEGVKFMFSTGDAVAEVRVTSPMGVSDGQWHHLEVQYYNRTAVLILDHCDAQLSLEHGAKLGPTWHCANRTEISPGQECSTFLNTCHTLLDLTGPLQLGALPGAHPLPVEPLDGCIRNLEIDRKFVDLNDYVFNNGTLSGCPERREFCMSHPCQNSGQCREGWGGYVCKCTQGWGGKDCSERLKPAKRLRGNGFALFNAGLSPVQLPWHNSLSFRTSQLDGLLMMVQIRKVGWSSLALVNGTLVYTLGDSKLELETPRLNDGEWHHASVKWMLGEIWLNLDYGQHELTKHTSIGIQGLTLGKIFVGGTEQAIDGTAPAPAFDGCIENVRVGAMGDDEISPTLESSVESGCENPNSCSDPSSSCPAHSTCSVSWSGHKCHCDQGFVGEKCFDVCHLNPCQHNSTCAREKDSDRGYQCQCNSPLLSGRYCEKKVKQPCPAKWWGYPVCGPCQCDVNNGFNPDCDKKTGECRCKDYHYQPVGSAQCLPCQCFPLGSTSQLCNPVSGQCQCKPGVIGQLCDSCAHKYAEVTEQGCQVVYKSCPKSFEDKIWWPRTGFGQVVEVECPTGAEGKALRSCNEESGWGAPDLFNCTHREMLPLFKDLTQLQNGDIEMTSYLTLKTVQNLYELTNSLENLYGADILLISRLLSRVLKYETEQSGFNLSHKQERDFIKQIVNVDSRILDEENLISLKKVRHLDSDIFVGLLDLFKAYGTTLARNRLDTYTNPFEITAKNIMFGLDTVDSLVREGNPQSRVQTDVTLASRQSQEDIFVIIPKYNHYMRDPSVWDNTKIHVPRSLLYIDEELGPDTRPTLSYVFYRTLPDFLPQLYQSDLVARWGSYFRAISSIVSLTVFTQTDLEETVELLNPVHIVFRVGMSQSYPRSTPFCARWDMGLEEGGQVGWTREGCETDLPDLWQFNKASEIKVNCTCYRISTYAVLTESAAAGLQVLTPVITDNVVFYATIASLIILLSAIVAFSILYGLPTNTNSIHRFIVLTLFAAQLLFVVAAKYHHEIVKIDFACKIVAILLHYFWLCVFSWLLVDALHLQRMLTELRDINHGHMKFYVAMGFGVPAVIVGLSVGVRGHMFGNLHFCWLSLYDVSVWSMVGPLCLALFSQICILFLAIRAAFTLKAQIEDFGNLRGMLLLNIGLLPLATGTWTCAFFLVNEDWHELSLAFSVVTLVTSTYIFLGYVAFNSRVRAGIKNRYLVCMGKKVPFGESINTSHGTISRSALAYRNSVKSSHRNIGISTASTTSRSTSKTNSTPYRSEYYSSSDVSKIYGSHKSGAKPGKDYQVRDGTDSESDMDQRSLDLASSHTSDEDEPLEPITSSETQGATYSTDYNTSVPPLHINTSSGSAGLQVNDQPMSAQNTLQRHHVSQDLRLSHQRWSERLSAITTSDNDGGGYGETGGGDPLTDPRHYPGYGYPGYPASPGSQSELSSEDKYVAMSPPHLLHQTYQQFSTTSQSTTSRTTEPTSSSLQASDQTVEYPGYPRHFS